MKSLPTVSAADKAIGAREFIEKANYMNIGEKVKTSCRLYYTSS